jgi:MFS transporter, Spinster family, sphingosine-1-phosphate transporter
MVNMDHGIFPACIDEVRKDINIGNKEVGLVGSIVYLGLVAGKLKHLLVLPRVLGCHSHFLALQYEVRVGNLPAPQRDQLGPYRCLQLLCTLPGFPFPRWFLPGMHTIFLIFLQVFFCIYFPVWVSLFAKDPKKKTLMFSLITLGVPLGVILGYILTAVIVNYFQVINLFAYDIELAISFLHPGNHTIALDDVFHEHACKVHNVPRFSVRGLRVCFQREGQGL